MVIISIELNGSHVFVAGERRHVAGTARIALASPLRAESVDASLTGVMGGHCFVRNARGSLDPRAVSHGETAVAFDLGAIDAALPGSHEERTGPVSLPGGYVRYFLEVTVVTRPFWKPNKRRYALLTVLSLGIPLRALASSWASIERYRAYAINDRAYRHHVKAPTAEALTAPFTVRSSKEFAFPSLATGSLWVSVTLPRTAYCVGEDIAATIRVLNSSSATVKDVVVRLCQNSVCHPGHSPGLLECCVPGRWSVELGRASTGTVVRPREEAELAVSLRVPPVAAGFLWENAFLLTMFHTFEVFVRYRGLGRPLWAKAVLDLGCAPRGDEERTAELIRELRPCLPWRVHNGCFGVFAGPHVQTLYRGDEVPTQPCKGKLPAKSLYIDATEKVPLCNEHPHFVPVNTHCHVLYRF
eukprot:m51a1_g10071 hypothetical protein (414) ;mRNA; r:19851-21239